MQPSRDDFVIAVRSAFLKKENKQKFSLIALILLTIIILILGKFNFKVEEGKELEYVTAWKKLMQSQLDLIPGSFGLNTISYGNRYVSHMVYLGANSMSDLSNALKNVRGTPEFSKFQNVAKDIRVNVNAELVQYVTSYNGE